MVGKPLPVLRNFKPTVYWYVSLRCNLACKHCWVNSSPSVDTSTDLTSVEMLEAVDNVAAFDPAAVILTGGEPLLRPDIELILDKLVSHRIQTIIETNAMIVSDRVIEIGRKANASGTRVHFAVSLDGGDAPSHDWCRGPKSFDKTIAGLEKLRAADLPADIQCVVNRRNWHTMKDLTRIAEDLGIYYLKFVLASPVGRANHFIQDLSIPFADVPGALNQVAEAIRGYSGKVIIKVPPAMIPPALQPMFRGLTDAGGCSVQNMTSCSFPLLGVLPDGSVTICAASRDSEEAYFGNIRTLKLKDIWAAQELDDHRARYVAADGLQGICGDCVFKQECKGACRAHAFTESGDFDGPYPICAEMDRQGHFPDMYRLSRIESLRSKLTAMAS